MAVDLVDEAALRSSPLWSYRMFEATMILASGSFFLLAGVLLEGSVGSWGVLLLVFSAPAILFHLLGWTGLALALREVKSDRSTTPMERRWMFLAFAASIAGFGVGLLTLRVGIRIPGGSSELPLFLIPFVPSVHAPVVVSHATLFLLGSRLIGKNQRTVRVAVGSSLLLLLAVVGLTWQAATFPVLAGPVIILAGLTSVGYGLVAAGWLRTYRSVAPAAMKSPSV